MSAEKLEPFFRLVKESDKDLIYLWANDPVTRKASFNQDMIPYDAHCEWFDKVLENPNTGFYILMDKELPVGQFRVNVKDDRAEINYSIALKFRGRGYGKKIIELGAERIREDFPQVKSILAEVKTDNVASAKCFIDNGFSKIYEVYELNSKLNDDLINIKKGDNPE